MSLTPTRERSKSRILGGILAAWFVGGLIAGGLGGLQRWGGEPEAAASGDTLAVHVAWSAFSSAVSATVCGLVALPFVRSLLTTDRAILIGIMPIFVGHPPVSRADFLERLIVVAVPMGLILGVILRVIHEPLRSRTQPLQG
ncbi:hypothetical protein [Paludisphaera soli]|uniref:hypothetical protein n=1 Tax=Paludisphaera soli TaxID=2712865 RepID=UPI0013ED0B24|nr:hypothetical protein [Paludisphaera soli]